MWWQRMFNKWLQPPEEDRALKEAALRETERIIADVRSLDLRIERAARRPMDEILRDFETNLLRQGSSDYDLQ